MDQLTLLLGDLSFALRECGENHFADMVVATSDGSPSETIEFLRSNELWGGSGSIADQAGISAEGRSRRAVEAAMIKLGEQQLVEGITNVRTKQWVDTFAEWRDGDI